jgi:branched-chain amino acid transport system substrate-binding protein
MGCFYPMHEVVKQVLRDLIDEYRIKILEDPDRLSQFLEDRCPADSASNFQLTFALRYLLKSGWTTETDLDGDKSFYYTERLCDNLAFSLDEARDVIDTLRSLTQTNEEDNTLSNDGTIIAKPGNLRRISGGISNKPRTMWLRKKSFYNGIVLIASLLAIVVLFFQIGAQRGPVGDEFRIAYFAPMSGPLAQNGHDQLKAAQLAVELVNRQGGVRGYKIKVIGFDTPITPSKAAEKVKEVMKDRSLLLMMTDMSGDTAEAMSAAADDIEVPLVITAPNISASATVGNDGKPYLYSFRITNDCDERAKMLAYFAIQGIKAKKIGLLYDADDRFCVLSHEAAARWVKVFGGKIVADLSYAENAKKDHTLALKAMMSSNVDVLMLPALPEKQTSEIMKQAKAIGFRGAILGEEYTDTLATDTGPAMIGSWWVNELTALDPQIRSVMKDYEKLYNEECPDSEITAALLSYDAVRWITASLYQAPGYRGEAIRHVLLSTRNLALTHATLTIDPRTHGPLNKAVAIVFCAAEKGIFQKRVSAKNDL